MNRLSTKNVNIIEIQDSEFINNIFPNNLPLLSEIPIILINESEEKVNLQNLSFTSNSDEYSETFVQACLSINLSNNIFVNDIDFIDNQNLKSIEIEANKGVTIQNLFSNNNKGLDYLGIVGTFNYDMNFQNMTFKHNNGTAIIYEELEGFPVENQKIYMHNITIEYMTSYQVSSGIMITSTIDCKDCILDLLNINHNICEQYGTAIVINETNNIYINNANIQNNTAITHTSGIYINSVNNITLHRIDLIKNNGTIEVGGLTINNSNDIKTENVLIDQNIAYYRAGFIFSLSNNIVMKNWIVSNNIAEGDIGGGKLEIIDNIQIDGLLVISNQAFSKGGMELDKITNSEFNSLQFKENQAFYQTGGLLAQELQDITFSNLKIQGNLAEYSNGGMNLIQSFDIDIQGLILEDNISNQNVGGLKIQSSERLNFNDLQIKNNQAIEGYSGALLLTQSKDINFQNGIFEQNQSIYEGGTFYIETCSIINFQSFKFLNNNAKFGAVGYIQLSQDITIEQCQFNQNQGEKGGSLFLTKTKSMKIDFCDFCQNTATKYGGSIYVEEDSDNILIDNSTFKDNQSDQVGGAVYVTEINDIVISNTNFENNKAIESSAGIYIEFSHQLLVSDTVLQHHNSEIASCIFAKSIEQLNFVSTTFKNNTSQVQAGCFYALNVLSLYIESSQFIKNYLLEPTNKITKEISRGGAIFLNKIEKILVNNTYFYNNSAYYQGGGIYMNNVNIVNINNNTFEKNTVNFDKSLTNFQKTEKYFLSQGGGIFISSESILTNNVNNLNFTLVNNTFSQSEATSGAGVFINQEQKSDNKDYTFLNNTFIENLADIGPSFRYIGPMGENIIQEISDDFNNLNQLQNDHKGLLSESKFFFGYFRNEKRSDSTTYQYQVCANGSYLKEGGSLQCDKCKQNGVCEGGYIPIYPDQYYWRQEIDSTTFSYCYQYPELCKGNDTCAEGHKGTLCEDCKYNEGYAKSFDGTCQKCENSGSMALVILIILTISLFIVSQQIYGINQKINFRLISKVVHRLWDKYIIRIENISSVSKIMLMHIQILQLTKSLNLEWSFSIGTLFSVIGNPSSSLSQQSQCLLTVQSEEQEKQQVYQAALIGIGFVLSIAIFLVILCCVFCVIRKINKIELIRYIPCCLICFFLTVQPGYIQHTFSFLVCKEIADVRYSKADNLLLCDSDYYQNTVLPVMIILFAFVSIIIPLILIISVFRKYRKNQLQNISVLRSIGILYIETKNKYFFWELLTLNFKSLIAIISIILSEDPIIRGCATTFFLFIYYHFSKSLRPYKSLIVNKLQICSLCVLIYTVLLSVSVKTVTNSSDDQSLDSIKQFTKDFSIIIAHLILTVFILLTLKNDIKFIYITSILRLNNLSSKISLHDRILKRLLLQSKSNNQWLNIRLAIRRVNLLRKESEKYKKQQFLELLKEQYRLKFHDNLVQLDKISQNYINLQKKQRKQSHISQFTPNSSNIQIIEKYKNIDDVIQKQILFYNSEKKKKIDDSQNSGKVKIHQSHSDLKNLQNQIPNLRKNNSLQENNLSQQQIFSPCKKQSIFSPKQKNNNKCSTTESYKADITISGENIIDQVADITDANQIKFTQPINNPLSSGSSKNITYRNYNEDAKLVSLNNSYHENIFQHSLRDSSEIIQKIAKIKEQIEKTQNQLQKK